MLAASGCEPLELPDLEVLRWQESWRAVYAKELYAATHAWVLDNFDWHVFSYQKHASKAGDAAWSEYRRLEPCSFRVLSAYGKETFGFACDGKPPDRLNLGIDVLVTPISLAWTMAFTHEGAYGPYFAVP